MKKDEIRKNVLEAIKAAKNDGIEPNKETIMVTLIGQGVSLAQALSAINACWKTAGLIPVVIKGASASIDEWLKEKKPWLESYKDVAELVVLLTEEITISVDDELAEKTALAGIRRYCTTNKVPMPKKIHLGEVKALYVEYFLDAKDNDDKPSIQGLTEYLIENVAGAGEDATEEVKKKLKVTAGTDFSFAYMLTFGIRLEDING